MQRIPWTKKYSPKKIAEIQGQTGAAERLVEWLRGNKKKKAALLWGPPGCGKTCLAYALASERSLELIEVNASDDRNAESMNSTVKQASLQQSLFARGKLILVDELDGVSGQQDRGGLSALAKIIDESAFPIVLTANDPYDAKFSTIRKKSEMMEMKHLSYSSIAAMLTIIAHKENLIISEETITMLARRAGGDLRGAIVDLEMLSVGNKKIENEEVEELYGRRQTQSIHQALMKIFKTSDPAIALSALDDVDEELDRVMLWIEENLPAEYLNPKDLAQAFNALSRADVFFGRIRRWQHWRFLVYVSALLTAGIALSKQEKNRSFVTYQPTSRILKIWIANQKNFKKKAIAHKIAQKTHSSTKEVMRVSFDLFRHTFRKSKEFAALATAEFDLDDEEVEWMTGAAR